MNTKFPVVLVTEFSDGKASTQILSTSEELQTAIQTAQNLASAIRTTIFEHHITQTKQTIWDEPPTTH
jgi:hypothetical protein